MAVLLFKLSNVPEDEADDVRQLLKAGGFDTYETSAGLWRIGVAAIWLTNPEQLPAARAALDSYQSERAARMREHYRQLKSQGQTQGICQIARQDPLSFAGYLLAVAVIIGLMVIPFIGFLSP